MFTAIMNNGDYQEINAKTIEQAKAWTWLRFTKSEIDELEIEIIDNSTGESYQLAD